MLPKQWLVSDLELRFQELQLELERLRQRSMGHQARIEEQGRQIAALKTRVGELRRRIQEQRERQTSSGSSIRQSTSLAIRTHS